MMSTSETSLAEQVVELNTECERLAHENESLHSQLVSALAQLSMVQEDQRYPSEEEARQAMRYLVRQLETVRSGRASTAAAVSLSRDAAARLMHTVRP